MTQFRNLRIRKGLNQEEFRKLYNEKYNRNYTSAAISMIEHGKRMPELGALMDFADFYGVSLDYLLGRTGELDNGQISSQLNCIVENLENNQESVNNAIENRAEIKENLRMLKCLLEQSAVLARRMEKEDNSWYRF